MPLIRQSQPALGDKNTLLKCRQNLSAKLKQVAKVTDFFDFKFRSRTPMPPCRQPCANRKGCIYSSPRSIAPLPEWRISRHTGLKKRLGATKNPWINGLIHPTVYAADTRFVKCPGGEIGIRSGLKIRQTRVYAGSSPARGTSYAKDHAGFSIRLQPGPSAAFVHRPPRPPLTAISAAI